LHLWNLGHLWVEIWLELLELLLNVRIVHGVEWLVVRSIDRVGIHLRRHVDRNVHDLRLLRNSRGPGLRRFLDDGMGEVVCSLGNQHSGHLAGQDNACDLHRKDDDPNDHESDVDEHDSGSYIGLSDIAINRLWVCESKKLRRSVKTQDTTWGRERDSMWHLVERLGHWSERKRSWLSWLVESDGWCVKSNGWLGKRKGVWIGIVTIVMGVGVVEKTEEHNHCDNGEDE